MRIQFALLTATLAGLLSTQALAADSATEKTRPLIRLLETNASFYEKARACQQLGEVGDREAVPVLAALLHDEHLNAYARSGLEGIPDPSATEALRSAAARLQGNRLAGVVNSLGVLRDVEAVGLLQKLADDSAAGVNREALLALGCIATAEALQTLRQFLVREPQQAQTNAASACLLAAEKQQVAGHADMAVALYDAVRQANLPLTYRAAATRGAIVARKEKGVPLLIEQLSSREIILRNAALYAIREMPGDALATALNTAMQQAPVELQIQLLTALTDCHNAGSLPVLRAMSTSENTEVRKTALTVLGKIGGAAEVGSLLQALADSPSAEESAIALDSLGRMEGTTIDTQIVAALASATNADLRLKLIRLVERRGLSHAVPELIKLAAQPDAKVGVAALRALKSLAGQENLSTLVALIRTSRESTVREAAEGAMVGTCTRLGLADMGGEMALTELQQTTNPVLKISWIRVLVALGHAKALPALLAALNDTQDEVALAVIEQLAHWPDPAPVDGLLAVAQEGPNTARTQRALASVIQLASTAAEAQQRPDETLIRWLQRASRLAPTTDQKRGIISGLGYLKQGESFDLLSRYFDEPELQNEAAAAMLQIAPALRSTEPILLRETLEKILAQASNADLRNQAKKLAETLPQISRTSLFDGQSLTGWEGNPNVWRVQERAIVGGSLNGNPRNEFLATVRSYTNFILRLEYRLVGTEGFVNGGVQFRSVRVTQPDNEMCGFQADIGAGYSGCLYDESRRNKFLVRATEQQIRRLEKPGDWNLYEVRCTGRRIQIMLNGEKTVDYRETDATLPTDGLIGLQIHGNCKAEISFRNLTIAELP